MKSLAVALAVSLLGFVAPSSMARPAPAPQWLLRSERAVLARVFEGARPVRVTYVDYPAKIAVVFEFSRVVVCGACSAPSAAEQPRGRVVRVSFDRTTHELAGARNGWAMRFCVSDGRPPPSVCLAR